MEKKKVFVAKALEKGRVTEDQALDIFEDLILWSAYAFCKARAVAYALIAYWDMYLKVHYPKEYQKVSVDYQALL